MSNKPVETSVILFADRFMPPAVAAEQAKAMETSGLVDYMELSDQLVNFIPPMLWTPENSPLAAVLPDLDSCTDAFVMAAYCLAAAPKLKLTLATDSIRHAPAELIQTMLTFANITGGNAMFQIGGGEVKQTKPYGWKRSEGLTRMEDLFKAFHAFLDNDGPINLDGHHWKYEKAYLGSAKQHRPKLWGLGGGPKLIDLSTTYADGIAVAVPSVWPTPEEAKNQISAIKASLRAKGRDPEQFGFGMWVPMMLHEDAEVINRGLNNPLVRWMAAMFGRVDGADWKKAGLESPVPEGWTYYQKLLPYDTSSEFVHQVLSKADSTLARKGMFAGTPRQVAEMLRPYIDAGATWVMPVDYMPLISTPEDAANSLARSIELCGYLKD